MTGKVLNNLVAAGSVALTRTALDWADSAGMDTQKLLDLMHTSPGQNWFASGFEDIEFSRDGYDPFNSIGLLKKGECQIFCILTPILDKGLLRGIHEPTFL